MLTLALIVTAELVVLLRLLLPSVLAYAETRHDSVYGGAEWDCVVGDWPAVPHFEAPREGV